MTNAIKIFLRRFYRNRVFGLLNISGLAVGIAISLVIFLIIQNELGIDRFHKNRDRIYRVVSTETFRNGIVDHDGDVPIPLPDALRAEFPQPEKVAAMYRYWELKFTIPGNTEKKFRTKDVYAADPALFDIFDFPWLAGDSHTALKEPYTLAITRTVAENWFGNWQNAIGKTVLEGDGRVNYKITGIIENPPANTDINFRVIISYATFRILRHEDLNNPLSWDNFDGSSQCFFLLHKEQKIESMQAMLPGFVAKHFTPLFANSDTRDSCYFQPFKEMHFDTNLYRYGADGWSYNQLLSIALIGIFILTMACINFINLATAQSFNRGKEVGIRKVLGSTPRKLLIDFLFETGAMVLIAIVVGCIIAGISLPALAQILQKPIAVDVFGTYSTYLFLLITGAVVTLMAGFYPAIVLSRFEPIAAIKSKINTSAAGGVSLRRGLIVLQFVIAQMLIIGTIVVVRQMDYFRDRPMGFDRTAITMISLPYSKNRVIKDAYFKSKVVKMPGVLSAALCSEPPSKSSGTTYFTVGGHSHPEDFEIAYRFADTDYLSTFHLKLVAGRFPYPCDTAREVVLNETTIKRLNLKPEDIVGNYIHWGNLSSPKIPVVGIVRDFNNRSLKESISPLVIFSGAQNYYRLAVKLDPAAIKNTMFQLQKAFLEEYPDQFFNTSFLDDDIASYYNSESIASKLFKIFAGLAIFISCLGLYGLVSFMVVQKTKEVGIRKVLGASVKNIIYIFSREFTILILIAFLVAAPLAYYFMSKWVSSFYYQIKIDWKIFALAIILSVVIAWITVSYKAVKAAMANPVTSLRNDG